MDEISVVEDTDGTFILDTDGRFRFWFEARKDAEAARRALAKAMD